MTNTIEMPAVEISEKPRKPDGTLTTQTDNQTIVFEMFFNHNSTETFQDKLLRVILAEENNNVMMGGLPYADK